MKKRLILAAMAAIMTMTVAIAQQIAVVSEGGEASVYDTFQAAIEGADPGSVIYLPGGVFALPDSVKITKRLTVIGIGNRPDNDNVDGTTMISGNLWFNEGSRNSAVMACYISGNIEIGQDDAAVNNILVKCCNLNAVNSKANSENLIITQNYIRNSSAIRGHGCFVSNNVLHSLRYMNSSTICYNLVRSNVSNDYYGRYPSCFNDVDNCNIYNNIIVDKGGSGPDWSCGGNQVNRNLFINYSWGNNCVNLTDCTWEDLFVNWNGGAINPISDFHFKEPYTQYNDIGIYGGNGFNDHQTAPVPYIVAKRIAGQTDAAGQLKIKVRVNSGN